MVDPGRVAVTGGSWGGYITLLALGLHPKRRVVGAAAVPVADSVTAFHDEAPTLQAFDALDADGQSALAVDLAALAHNYDRHRDGGSVAIGATYLETVLTAR